MSQDIPLSEATGCKIDGWYLIPRRGHTSTHSPVRRVPAIKQFVYETDIFHYLISKLCKTLTLHLRSHVNLQNVVLHIFTSAPFQAVLNTWNTQVFRKIFKNSALFKLQIFMPVTLMVTNFRDVIPCSLVASHPSRAWRQWRLIQNTGYYQPNSMQS